MGFISAFFRLTRFEHALMLAIAVLIGEAIALGALPPLTIAVILSLLVPVFSEMGSFALNDYFDIESDRINKRANRPLVSGEISPQFALYFSILSLLVSTALAYFINIYAFAIALVFNLLAVAYNYKLKDMPFAGNFYIGLSMAIPFVFGSAAVTGSLMPNPVITVVFIIALIAGIAREILKSVQDMEGDRKARKSETLPIKIGEESARRLAAALYFGFVPLSLTPFYYGLSTAPLGLILVAIADIGILYIAYSVWSSGKPEVLKMARGLGLACFFIGLIGLLYSALFPLMTL